LDYTELSARIVAYSENPNLTALLDTFIDFAESKIYREIDFKHCRLTKTSSLIVGDEQLTLPSDCYTIRSIQVLDGTQRNYLFPKDLSFMNAYWPVRTETAFPKYYGWMDNEKLMLAPTPDDTYSVEMTYSIRPAQMSASNDETVLGDRFPNLLFLGVMLEVLAYQKGEVAQLDGTPESPGYWERAYKAEVSRVQREQMMMTNSDNYYSGEPSLR
jgi:hypothetical protein